MPRLIFIPEYYDDAGQDKKNLQRKMDYYLFQKNSRVFNFLNRHDKDVVLLMFVKGKTQNDAAMIFDVAQPRFSYDKNKVASRITFICDIQKYIDRYLQFLEFEAGDRYDEDMKLVLTAMLYTTSFARSSEITGMTYAIVRARFSEALSKLKREDPEVYEVFDFVNNNRNTLRRIEKDKSFSPISCRG